MKLETKTILITVKAYPNPSKKYGETSCCAGIDINTLQWIRLYPIPFRDLEQSQKFKKYNIIKVKCYKSTDKRIESYKADSDSIEILDHLNTDRKWASRRKILMPTASFSFCDITKSVSQNKSLGMFKPCDISFVWKRSILENIEKRKASYAQLSLLDKKKLEIEQIPFDFYYKFKCDGLNDCPGHKLLIVDWELKQSYRKWRHNYRTEDMLLKKIEERWYNYMCSEKCDTYFFVGNQRRFVNQFMLLGVFYPQK